LIFSDEEMSDKPRDDVAEGKDARAVSMIRKNLERFIRFALFD